MKVRDNAVIDQEAIYARLIGLIVSQRELGLTEVFSCELAAYPPSMFNPDGSMRIAANENCLKNSLAVETSVCVWGQPSVIKSPRYTGGDFMFLYRFVRRHRRPQILVHAITFEQLFGFLSFLARLLALTYRLTD